MRSPSPPRTPGWITWELVYTPTLSGLKEEILLAKYAGVNTFTFLLNTDGLGMYQENGRWYLAETQNAQSRVELGDVVTFDANGRFSVGTMTSQTISAGNIYRLTLTVDEEFLTDESTVYPLSTTVSTIMIFRCHYELTTWNSPTIVLPLFFNI